MVNRLVLAHGVEDENYYGALVIPLLGLRLEQLILILYPALLIPAVAFWYIQLQASRARSIHPPGCRRLMMKGPSNVRDEYDEKYDAASDPDSWKIKALFMHPIKSCAATELEEVDIRDSGMTWDRKFAFAELLPQRPTSDNQNPPPKWTFRTLRQPGWEKLALVKPEIWVPVEPSTTKSLTAKSTGILLIKYPTVPSGFLAPIDRYLISKGWLSAQSSFQVPLTPPVEHKYPKEVINIWSDNPTWLNYSSHIPDEFREYISPKYQLGLFRVDPSPETFRKVFRNAPRQATLGYQPTVGFQDAYPLHLLNLASVHDVGNRVRQSIPQFSSKRFRANILVTGPKAYDEDDWKVIRVSSPDGESHIFHCACHTVRCRLPNVDPDTSHRHGVEPDKTLKGFRCIDEGDPKNACLGLQLVPGLGDTGREGQSLDQGGSIRIRAGDQIEVLERGSHLYIKQDLNESSHLT